MSKHRALGNIWRVFTRDVKRLGHAPAAWVVAIALIVLPSLYTWFNVYGFWNPYDNTGALRVCVVNEDDGAHDETLGDIQVGDLLVQKLSDNDQMGWEFIGRDEAMAELEAGQAYAVFVIPKDFSKNIAALATGSLKQAKIEYYVNEKKGPVSPKIMDTGANALENTINSAFVSTVSSVVAETVDQKTSEIKADVSKATATASQRVAEAETSLSDIRTKLGDLKTTVEWAADSSAQARGNLQDSKGTITSLSNDLQRASQLMGDVSTSLSRLSLSLGTALDSGSSALSFGSTQTNLTMGKVAAMVTAGKGEVDGALAKAEAATTAQDDIIALMTEFADTLPEGDAKAALTADIATMEEGNSRVKALVTALKAVSSDIGSSATSITDAAAAVTNATQAAIDASNSYRDTLNSQTLPSVGSGIAAIAGINSSLATAVASQTVLVDQASAILAELETALWQTSKAFEQTDGILASAQDELMTIRADLAALGSADALNDLVGEGVDPAELADFMLSPTKVETENLYHLDSYGSAMAPLFINLTLWIGVFMLMVIMRNEVDGEGLRKGTTVAQRFMGRQLLLSIMAALQAVVCCVGCLLMGVQTVNAGMFILTAAIASLAYLAIQYSLSTTFQHLGKALCVILVFVQIPGATGLYPIEMTTEFFRNVYPLFPFTYGINAIRETVFGFYGSTWGFNIAVLAGFWLAFTLVGTLVKPLATNLNLLFERHLKETELINIEHVELPARRYRVEQLISVLSDRTEFRTDIERRAQDFMRAYPILKVGAAVAGIGVPLIVTPILMTTGVDKVIILTSWLLWLIVLAVFLVIVEYIRENMVHQMLLPDLSGSQIRDLYFMAQGNRIAEMLDIARQRRGRHEREESPADDDAAFEREAPLADAPDTARTPKHAAPGSEGIDEGGVR